MVDAEFPAERVTRHVYLWIERASILRCNQAVLTTSGSKQLYETRYANVPPERWQIIANGYDEDNFVAAEKAISAITSRKTSGRIVLVHSGLLYPSERDPTAFFCALRDLLEAGDISPGNLAIVLRDSGNEEYYARLIHEHGIECIVSLEPAISYSEALMEMLNADGLLILQASNCNHLIPAKAYEYLRARRPILALTDPLGDTATLLRKVGVDTIAPLNSSIKIATGLRDFLARVRNGSAPVANDAEIATHSREARTKALAQLFDRIASARQEISPAR
jgi:glycosyltransferase involved in cell wall biosynthesis